MRLSGSNGHSMWGLTYLQGNKLSVINSIWLVSKPIYILNHTI